MAGAGFQPLRQVPFLWTTRVNGSDGWRRWFSWVIPREWERGDHLDWQAAAKSLTWYCEAECKPDAIIAHSHAGQVVAYACANEGLTVPLLITVSTPVRADMDVEYQATRKAVGTWRHLYDPSTDPIQWAGGFGDGSIHPTRLMRWAHENYAVDGAGHAGALHDPRFAQEWQAEGWLR